MDSFVQRANIARFKEMLLAEDNPARLKTLRELLAKEEADLFALEKAGNAEPPRGGPQGFDGAFLTPESKDALWAGFFTEAPPRLRRSVERYNIVKRA